MSRYIDADELLMAFGEVRADYNCFNELERPRYEMWSNAIDFINTMAKSSIDIVKCKECRWARPKTLKGETGYRCLFYRTRKAHNGYCDCGERKTEQAERAETMSCQECKWWFTDSLKHGGYCQSLLYNHECRYEPEVDCSWK